MHGPIHFAFSLSDSIVRVVGLSGRTLHLVIAGLSDCHNSLVQLVVLNPLTFPNTTAVAALALIFDLASSTLRASL